MLLHTHFKNIIIFLYSHFKSLYNANSGRTGAQALLELKKID